jgi:putative endonuclease
MFYVYILYSSSLEKFYVGSSDNVAKRIDQHNSGRGNFTSKGSPWELIVTIECKSRSEAIALETRIKKRGIKRYLQDNHLV